MAEPLILNQQSKYVVSSSRLGEFVRELRQALRLGRRDCNVCFVDDRQIKRLNSLYLGKNRATDVLSFPWMAQQRQPPQRPGSERARSRYTRRSANERAAWEFKNFLGDIVISVETAKRNARQEGHSTLNEMRWLILHGVLHLLGYNHEQDHGEMTRLELAMRSRLGIS
ncbi:MAG: rRNA maturation RNase YbeY [Terriglobia bacterium]|jgi:probable rRNA maturation factor